MVMVVMVMVTIKMVVIMLMMVMMVTMMMVVKMIKMVTTMMMMVVAMRMVMNIPRSTCWSGVSEESLLGDPSTIHLAGSKTKKTNPPSRNVAG